MQTTARDEPFTTIRDAMQKTTLMSIPWRLKRNQLISLTLNTSVRDALATLTENNILSAPVFDASNCFQGFADMEQLTRFVVRLADGEIPTTQWWTKHDRIRTTTLRDLIYGIGTGGRQIHGEYRTPVTETMSIYHAVERMAREGQHRLGVMDVRGRVVSVITQSAIVQYLFDNLTLLGDARTTPVSKIRPYTFVTTVRDTALALRGFEQMDRRNTSLNGIGIVDASGRLVDVLSTHDLRGITPGSSGFNKLYMTLRDFKKDVQTRYPTQGRSKVTCVTATDTLEGVIRLMATDKVHRVFVVNDKSSMVPSDLITQTDILRFLLSSIKTSWW